jgi:hypothetical protein
VFSLSHLYVAAHQNEMLTIGANERLARKPASRQARKSDRTLGAALKSAWSLLSGPAERPISLPTLTNYPYRG